MNEITKHFVNLGAPIKEDTSVYRVFSRSRLFEMFTDKKLTLAAPDRWDDPFENFLSKCKATVDGQDVTIEGLFRNFYGQCWTLQPESDAMWRIYSPCKDGAKVKTTVGRLFRSIYDPKDPFVDLSYYVGSVGYHHEAELLARFTNSEIVSNTLYSHSGWGQAATLFLKRMEFEHEREVRLLYRFNGSSDQHPDRIWHFPMDPHALFDEVVFDPRMDDLTFRTDVQRLRSLGFCKPVTQSPLYKLPNLVIEATTL